MDLAGLTPSDEDALGRMLEAFESGALTRRIPARKLTGQRVYEAVPVINTAGEIIPAYAVMRITTPTTVDGDTVVNVAKPDTSFNRVYLVNSAEPIDAASGSRGWGTFAWDSDQILYDSGTPALGESWGPKSGQWSLSKWRYGFTIIGGNDTTNLKTTAAQHWVNEIYGQTQGAISKGATNGVVEPFDGNGTILNASTTVTVSNPFCAVSDDKKVTCKWCGGTWFLDAGEA